MLLSVIIPVYGVEEYIEKCILSLKKQDLESCEYIVVDDGTLDDSINIAKKLAEGDPRFTFVKKENGGLSSARNFGLKHAKGEYIYFMDSDDYIERDVLSKFMQIIERHNVDCFVFEYRKIDISGDVLPHKNYYKEVGILDGVDFLNRFTTVSNVWIYIYKASILKSNSVFFKKGIFHEDELFTPIALSYCSSVLYRDIIGYNYLDRPGSIMNNKEKMNKRIRDRLIVINELIDFGYSSKNEKLQRAIFKRVSVLILGLMLSARKLDTKYEIYKNIRKVLKENPLIFKNASLKHKLGIVALTCYSKQNLFK